MPKRFPFLTLTAARVEAHLSTHGITDLFLFIYFTSVGLAGLWGFWTEFVKPKNGDFRWYIGLARSAGYALNLNTALVLLLTSRLFLTALRDSALSDVLPLDKAFPALHIVVAYTTLACVVVHVPFHFVWIAGWDKWSWGVWQVNMTVITGCILLVVFIVLVAFANPRVRKNRFRTFYSVHLVAATLFFALLIVHGMYEAKPETYKWVAAPLIIYALDRVVRLFRVSAHRLQLSADNSSFKDDNVLQLRIPKPFSFRPGQYAEIRVPSINNEWHPFTIASAEYEPDMSFYIKLLGDWTRALHAAFQARLTGSADEPLELFVRGPFGAPTQHVHKYSRLFLISGGIGATPFASICKQLNHEHEVHDARIRSQHRPAPDEPVLDDATEHRIRSVVKNIYDVDIDVLDPAEKNGRNTTPVKNHGRDDVAAHRIQYVSDMLHLSTAAHGGDPDLGIDELDAAAERHPHGDDDLAHKPSSTDDALEEIELGGAHPQHAPTPASSRSRNRKVLEVAISVAESDDEDDGEESASEASPVSVAVAGTDAGDETDDAAPNSSFKQRIKAKVNDARRSIDKRRVSMLRKPAVITKALKVDRQRKARLGDWRSNLLIVLHSSRMAFALAMLCVARMAVCVCGSIFGSGYVEMGTPFAEGEWVPLVYGILSTPLALTSVLTVALELSVHFAASFSSSRRVAEFVMFGPVAVVLAGVEFRRWASRDPGGPVLIFVQYVLAQSVTFMLIVGRMWRAVGRRGLLGDRHKHVYDTSPNYIPDADFVWTSADDDGDKWLRRELTPVTLGRAVTVHRYITRSKPNRESLSDAAADVEQGRRVSVALDSATRAGRPDWTTLLDNAARHTRSDGVVAIFFCGPKPMGTAVRAAAKKVEMWSNLRDAYLRSVSVPTLMRDIGLMDESVAWRLRDFGCRVRFVYHEENFS